MSIPEFLKSFLESTIKMEDDYYKQLIELSKETGDTGDVDTVNLIIKLSIVRRTMVQGLLDGRDHNFFDKLEKKSEELVQMKQEHNKTSMELGEMDEEFYIRTCNAQLFEKNLFRTYCRVGRHRELLPLLPFLLNQCGKEIMG
jgi:hypothetical protein